MAEEKKFNPAPPDKHADDPKQARKADKEMHDALDKGLEGTFPASDPVSSTQPAKSKRTPIRRKGSANRRTSPDRASARRGSSGLRGFLCGTGRHRRPSLSRRSAWERRDHCEASPLLATSPHSSPRRIRLQGGASRRLHDVRAGGNGEVELKTCRLCEDDAHMTSLTPHDVAGV